jgi:hypothetical protein
MAENLSWKDAIVQVLERGGGPLHYNEIAQLIAERGLRTDLGATPASTVSSQITTSIQRDPESPFVRAGRGIYSLRNPSINLEPRPAEGSTPVPTVPVSNEQTASTGLVNALGMFWDRSKVIWNQSPRILGQQQPGSMAVDFGQQRGIYLLHDHQGTVYVGRITDQGLGRRLWQHTIDRLNSRWDRFSWFGVYPVREDGSLHSTASFNVDINTVIITMEAVLIEGMEPRQNRKRGDDLQAVEFIQVEDPLIERERKAALVRELSASVLGERR